MKRIRNLSISVFAMAIGSLCAMPNAFAVPDLQIYVEGGTYNTTTETWVTMFQ